MQIQYIYESAAVKLYTAFKKNCFYRIQWTGYRLEVVITCNILTTRFCCLFVQLFAAVLSSSFYSFFFRYTVFPFKRKYFVVRFTETIIILLRLAEYEMLITNLALRNSLVGYHLIFGVPL